jgi:protoheme IX farnesyltransferase
VKTGSTLCTPDAPALPVSRARWLDFVELTKPRIAVLVLFTVAIGAMLASPDMPDLVLLIHTLAGTALVAAGASALNQLIERHSDARMRRTENRPLPAGRLQPLEVLAFGVVLSAVGLVWLGVSGRHPLALTVAAVTHLSYVLVYTPLKRCTTLNTLVGAVPGALPPVIGWTSVTGSLDLPAMLIFFVVFLWQVPHFLAIAWMYRDDYARAGLRMLPVVDRDGSMTARQMLLYCFALLSASLLPVLQQKAGWVYGAGAIVLGLMFLHTTWGFAREQTRGRARRVLKASLVYLPALLALMLLEAFVTGKIYGFQN